MTAKDIQDELERQGFDVDAVAAWKSGYYVVGQRAEDYPAVNGYDPVDDPTLEK